MTWLGDPWGMYDLPRDQQVELLALWRVEVQGAPERPEPPANRDALPPSERFRVS